MGDFIVAECVFKTLCKLEILTTNEMNSIISTAKQIPEGGVGRAKAAIIRNGLHADSYLTIFNINGSLWLRTKKMFHREWFAIGCLPLDSFSHCLSA